MTDLKSSKLLANNWVITLTATLIGVFAALYLNEWVASNKLNSQKEIATKNILAEISSNQKTLEEAIIKHTESLDFMEFRMKYVDEENNLIAPLDSMNKFRNKYPQLLIVTDSTLQKNGNYLYKGETYFDFSIPRLGLTNIAWKTLKSSNLSTTYGFECLMFLEKIDNLINDIFQKGEINVEYMTGYRDSGIKNKNLLINLEFLIFYEKMLIQAYQQSEEKLKNCD